MKTLLVTQFIEHLHQDENKLRLLFVSVLISKSSQLTAQSQVYTTCDLHRFIFMSLACGLRIPLQTPCPASQV